MSREKQIEEIANVIYDDPNAYDTYWRSNCEQLAETIYNAGYRKQSEGRWTPRHKDTKAFCTKCGALRDIETQEFWSFCPNCGAKMKGGAE